MSDGGFILLKAGDRRPGTVKMAEIPLTDLMKILVIVEPNRFDRRQK
jgi:hypothetical protein